MKSRRKWKWSDGSPTPHRLACRKERSRMTMSEAGQKAFRHWLFFTHSHILARCFVWQVPVDLVIDHSVQVDHAGVSNALSLNMEREFQRNSERFAFLKWGAKAFRNMLVVPPGAGIVHQVRSGLTRAMRPYGSEH